MLDDDLLGFGSPSLFASQPTTTKLFRPRRRSMGWRQMGRMEATRMHEWSADDADREQRLRVKDLRASANPVHHELARILEECRPSSRCMNAACAICSREFGMVVGPQIAAHCDRWSATATTTFGTIFRRAWLVKPGRLDRINISRLKAMLTRQFARRFNKCLVMGTIEVVWRPEFRRFLVHAHFVLVGAPPEAVSENLKDTYPSFRAKLRDRRILAHPKYRRHPRHKLRARKMRDIPDVAGLAGYFTKFSTAMKEKLVGRDGRLQPGATKRPPTDIHVELLAFLGRHCHSELMLWRHVRLSPKAQLFMPVRSYDTVASNFCD